MEKRGIAAALVTLCLISVIIGIINTLNPTLKQDSTESNQSFQSVFSSSGNKIALISLVGPIASEQSSGIMSSDQFSAESVKRSIARATEDNSVKGVLFAINTPGGTVAMSQEIHAAVMRLRAKKPVVFAMSDVAASGGYYIACAGDRIFAEPGTLTGSIGVIFSTFNAQQLFSEKLGIKSNVIKSGKFKDIGSMYRTMSPEEKSLLQDIINNSYQQFLGAITEGRVNRNDKYDTEKTPLTLTTLKQYADGRVFTGEQAKKLGFVDSLGGTYEADKAIQKMAKSKFHLKGGNLPVVSYNKSSGISDFLSSLSESLFSHKDSMSSLLPFSAKYNHTPLYMWE